MTKLNHQDTLYLQDVVEIGGDLLLLPRMQLPNLSESLALQKAGVINVGTSLIARNTLLGETLSRQEHYVRSRMKEGVEPAWIEELPLRLRMWLRYSYAIEQEEPLSIMNCFPNTGIWYMVREDGLCEKVARLFDLWRLQNIKQLGFLQQPWIKMEDRRLNMPINEMSRYVHSLDVMCLASVIGYNLGLPETEFNTLRVAAFTHDWGTPAGGDSVKLVDLKAFDEDLNYERLLGKLNQEEWQHFQADYKVNQNLLVQTILNQGLLGQILDLADKLSYVARDIVTVLGVMLDPNDDEVYVGTRALQELVDAFPYLCSIWDSVKVVKNKLVFTDVWRLVAFLKARITLFRELYYHPRARFGEYLISRVLVKMLYERGELTRDMLLEMNDYELERLLDKTYGQHAVMWGLSTTTKVQSFTTREEAEAFKKELGRSGNRFALIEDHLRSIKTGTDFLVETRQGPMPLSNAYPGDAQELFEMANMLPAVHVYYFGNEEPLDSKMADLVDLMQQTTASD
ncbi:MAG: hypothetical protein Q8P58_00965 [Candidatus Adlerbacteria bacterium]|nr:hypothetical protein [Candidatus Adlerbacteria bacterium]